MAGNKCGDTAEGTSREQKEPISAPDWHWRRGGRE